MEKIERILKSQGYLVCDSEFDSTSLEGWGLVEDENGNERVIVDYIDWSFDDEAEKWFPISCGEFLVNARTTALIKEAMR